MKKSLPVVSVVITAFNKGDFIGETLGSVFEQSLKDFECILVDDGSTDNTREKCSLISDSRFKYVFQKHSGLPACARNHGLSLAAGKFIALLDGDDIWKKDKLKTCIDALETNPNISLVWHNMLILYEQDTVRVTDHYFESGDFYRSLLLRGNCIIPSAVVFRREIFSNDGFKFSEAVNLRAIEDYEFWLQLSPRYNFKLIPEVLGAYRVTESGIYLGDIDTNTANMLSLLERHFANLSDKSEKLIRIMDKRRSSVMCGAGRMHQHKKCFKSSRKWYTYALHAYRFNFKALAGYILVCLGIRLKYK